MKLSRASQRCERVLGKLASGITAGTTSSPPGKVNPEAVHVECARPEQASAQI
jgi:hypothetical protein